jgi:hypothetical protein
MPKNDFRRARARRHGSTVAKRAANFSNYFLLFSAGISVSRKGAKSAKEDAKNYRCLRT